jgi:hypothetical protein
MNEKFETNVTNHKVPTLKEVLQEARKYNLEFKRGRGDMKFIDSILGIA